MPLDFPNLPTDGQIFNAAGVAWMWDGIKWTSVLSTTSAAIINVKDYGAKGDGVTNDAAAFNAAISAALAQTTGGKVFVPDGKYVIGSAIVTTVPPGKSLVIEGTGMAVTVLYFSNATDGLVITLDNAASAWGGAELGNFSVIRGPTSPMSANTGLSIGVVPGGMCNGVVILRDIMVRGSTANRTNQWARSVVLAGPNGAIIENVMIYAPDGAATDAGDVLLSIAGGPSANQYATSFNVLNCLMQGGSAGIDVTGWVQGVFVSNSTIIGQYDSIRWLDPGGTHVAEELAIVNSSLNGRHRGVFADSVTQSTVSGTTVLCFAAAATANVGMEFKSTFLTSIMGNNVLGDPSTSVAGIMLTDSADSLVMGNAIINVNSGTGIYLKGSTSTCSVNGNAIVNGASVAQDTGGNTFFSNTLNGIPLQTVFRAPVVFTTTAGTPRWFVGNDGSTEGTGDTGNDFEIVPTHNDGSLNGSVTLRINRATGKLFVTSLSLSGLPTSATGLGAGDVWRNGTVLNII